MLQTSKWKWEKNFNRFFKLNEQGIGSIEAYRIFHLIQKIRNHYSSPIINTRYSTFKNGQTKFLYHETDMRIPIANAIYENNFDLKNILYPKKDIIKDFEGLKFKKLDKKRFPIVTLYQNILELLSPIILNASTRC